MRLRKDLLIPALIIAGLSATGLSLAQTAHLSSHFLLNPVQVNPAMTGIRPGTNLTLGARQQWIGLEGAPSTQTFAVNHGVYNRNSRYNPRGFLNRGDRSFSEIGLGGGVFNFGYGAINHTGIHFEYAYHVFIGKGRLGLGLAPLYHQLIINKSGFILPDGEAYDPLVHDMPLEVQHFFDANIGAHYIQGNGYAGFSVNHLFNSRVTFGSLVSPGREALTGNPFLARTASLYAGYAFGSEKGIMVEPSVLVSHNQVRGAGGQANLLLRIYGQYLGGMTWRHGECLGFMAGFDGEPFSLRYLYEIPMGNDIPNRFHSHQILAGYRITSR